MKESEADITKMFFLLIKLAKYDIIIAISRRPDKRGSSSG
jgi:hypothetical protein